MSNFKKYIHLERYGTDPVADITLGTCFIFPKLDGTNASIWNENGVMQCGSRNRHLTYDDDNAGFYKYATANVSLLKLIQGFPNWTFYGEWLVPHSLKTYREDVWRKFYIFDVLDEDGNFIHYNEYSEIIKKYGVDYIPCTSIAKNPTYEQLCKATEDNKFLLQENTGCGEGIVIKQYDFTNKFGNTVWAKLITNTFKDKHVLEMGGTITETKLVEEEVAEKYVTEHMVKKVLAKIQNTPEGFSARNIPQLLGMVWYDLIMEESWDFVKEFKNPRIDFRTLNQFTILQTKKALPEIFGIKQ